MRKSGWAAAAGLISAAMLLTACGGSSSSSTGSTSGSTPTVSAQSTSNSNGGGAQPTASTGMSSPPPGTVYFTVQHSAKGWILAEGGKPVYTFTGDAKGKAGTYSGAAWPEVKAQNPQVSAADSIPGSLTVVSGQVLYNGMPLYTYGSKSTVLVHPSAEWKLVPMSGSYIKQG
jgi:predicted lipoprotein with Yx(FWY)xxD motif